MRWTLSDRQREVLDLVCKGYTNREIARWLNISLRTVEQHVSALYLRTGARNRVELARHGLAVL